MSIRTRCSIRASIHLPQGPDTCAAGALCVDPVFGGGWVAAFCAVVEDAHFQGKGVFSWCRAVVLCGEFVAAVGDEVEWEDLEDGEALFALFYFGRVGRG